MARGSGTVPQSSSVAGNRSSSAYQSRPVPASDAVCSRCNAWIQRCTCDRVLGSSGAADRSHRPGGEDSSGHGSYGNHGNHRSSASTASYNTPAAQRQYDSRARAISQPRQGRSSGPPLDLTGHGEVQAGRLAEAEFSEGSVVQGDVNGVWLARPVVVGASPPPEPAFPQVDEASSTATSEFPLDPREIEAGRVVFARLPKEDKRSIQGDISHEEPCEMTREESHLLRALDAATEKTMTQLPLYSVKAAALRNVEWVV